MAQARVGSAAPLLASRAVVPRRRCSDQPFCRDDPMSVPRFSVSQITTLDWPFERDVAFYAERRRARRSASRSASSSASGSPRAVRLVRDAGLAVSCLTSSGCFPLDDDAAASRPRWRGRATISAAAAELGAELPLRAARARPGALLGGAGGARAAAPGRAPARRRAPRRAPRDRAREPAARRSRVPALLRATRSTSPTSSTRPGSASCSS